MQICEHLLPANTVVNSHRIENMKKSPNIVDLIFTMIRVRPCQKLESKYKSQCFILHCHW